MTDTLLSPLFCSHNGVVILSSDSIGVRFGMKNGADEALKIRIQKKFPERQISFETIDEATFNLNLSRFFSDDMGVVGSREASATSAETRNESVIDKLDTEAPIINLLNSVFLEAISRRASDIHIESESSCAIIRYRIDGYLVKSLSISADRASALSARLKLLANINVMESRKPQDGRLCVVLSGNSLDVRISVVPSVYGESIVLRLLNRMDQPMTLDSLGFMPNQLREVERIIASTNGLVVVTGPTGSGKTTTLSTILRAIKREGIKIISLEDPVENRIEGITQIQINDDLGLSFETLLRRIFRQDPDIIMIGEIRDPVTAELAVRAALTGHLVFATLHTNSAVQAIVRLQDMGIPPYLVASTLRGVIGQRLVRKVCPSCEGTGCVRCSETGFFGRTVLAETILVTDGFAELIRASATPAALKKSLDKAGFVSIHENAREKVRLGITSEAEYMAELGKEYDRR